MVAPLGASPLDEARQRPFFTSDRAQRCRSSRGRIKRSSQYNEMEPIAELIKDADIQSLAGLRAKALVAIWDSRPISAIHNGVLNFEDEFSCYSLVTGAPSPACRISSAPSSSNLKMTPRRGWSYSHLPRHGF